MTSGRNELAGYLPVDEIRKLRPEPDHPEVLNLDVEWETAMENGLPSGRAGADGHSGIARLNQDRASDGTNLRNHRKSLRGKLARLANLNRVVRIVQAPNNGPQALA